MMNNIERKIAAGVIAASIAFGGAGCGTNSPAEKPNFPQNTSGELVPGVNPTASAETTKPTSNQTETVMNAELAMAPEIAGLTKEIINNKVTYMSKEGNGYGLEANSYAGEFKKEVTVEGTQTGGVALVSKVAEKLLTDAVAKIPEGQNKLKVIVPLDISNIDNSETININPAIYSEMSLNVLTIDYKGKIPLVNVQPGKNHFNIGPGTIPLAFKEKDKVITIQNVAAIIPVVPSNGYSMLCVFSKEFAPDRSFADLNFGDKLNLEVSSPIILEGLSNISGPKIISINTADLLTVDNHPVFMVANSTSGK